MMRNEFLKYIGIKNPKVLDLGAGSGQARNYFGKGVNYVGVDIKGANGIVKNDVLDFMQQTEETWDIIMSEFCFQFLDKEKLKNIMPLIFGKLRKQGYFYLASFNEEEKVSFFLTQKEYFSFVQGNLIYFKRYKETDPPHNEMLQEHEHSITEMLVEKI